MLRACGAWEGEGVGCRQGNPSPSHASGAGPFLSLWERSFEAAPLIVAAFSL
jgi:hypothetical protein